MLALASCGGEDEVADQETTTTVSVASTTTLGRSTTSLAATVPTSSIPGTTTTLAEEEPEVGDSLVLEIQGGEVVGGTTTISVELGSTVEIVVNSDAAVVVHVHGYDLFYDVVPGSAMEIMFTADVPGVFEIELERSHTLIAELEVS